MLSDTFFSAADFSVLHEKSLGSERGICSVNFLIKISIQFVIKIVQINFAFFRINLIIFSVEVSTRPWPLYYFCTTRLIRNILSIPN